MTKETIKKIIEDLEKYPEWRFGQWFWNKIMERYSPESRGTSADPFHIQDKEILRDIESID